MRVKTKDEFRGYGLCSGCKMSTFMRHVDGSTVGKCSVWHPPLPITTPVEACTAYRESGSMDLYDMKKIGIIIEINTKGEIGFLRPGSADYKKIMEAIPDPPDDDD